MDSICSFVTFMPKSTVLAGDGLQEGGDGVRRSMRVSRAPLAWYLNDFKHFSRKNHRSTCPMLLVIDSSARDAWLVAHMPALTVGRGQNS